MCLAVVLLSGGFFQFKVVVVSMLPITEWQFGNGDQRGYQRTKDWQQWSVGGACWRTESGGVGLHRPVMIEAVILAVHLLKSYVYHESLINLPSEGFEFTWFHVGNGYCGMKLDRFMAPYCNGEYSWHTTLVLEVDIGQDHLPVFLGSDCIQAQKVL
ncbi:hypothetical protein Nepgr_013658 [Nepenthes gracilis]|uniref:Uncharacterized protein n=1 Tax=Nepenthes gracilis TaxID=150966 RepID=A0AAD3XNV2_NEPGR|nr:hypothetical protein Nepgr_013658 [Nepenthes gracilis]